MPPIRQLFHDLARGRGFPSCAMAGAGNIARHAWASAPQFCPPQYIGQVEVESGQQAVCAFSGVISVAVDGGLFSRTWWSMGGDSVTEFSDAAKARFMQSGGQWDTRFDTDLATWKAQQVRPAPPTEPGQGGF